MAENKPNTGVRKLRNGKLLRPLRQSKKKERKCGLCGSTTKELTKTACCRNWICDDEDTYHLFSYATNSCWRNHQRYTLCSSHYHEDHKGVDWQYCEKCKDGIDTPNYVYFGTNDFNFEKLPNPEKVSISCSKCGFTTDTIDYFVQSIENVNSVSTGHSLAVVLGIMCGYFRYFYLHNLPTFVVPGDKFRTSYPNPFQYTIKMYEDPGRPSDP